MKYTMPRSEPGLLVIYFMVDLAGVEPASRTLFSLLHTAILLFNTLLLSLSTYMCSVFNLPPKLPLGNTLNARLYRTMLDSLIPTP